MKKLSAVLLLALLPSMAHALSWDGQGYTEDTSIAGTEKLFLENPAGTGNNWATLSTVRTYMGAAAWPTVAGIPYWTSGTSWGGAYPLDTNIISGVSASDDTIPSAKAVDDALDLKAPLANPEFSGGVSVTPTNSGSQYFKLFEKTGNGSGFSGFAAPADVTNSQLMSMPATTPTVGGLLVWGTGATQTLSDTTTATVIPVETLSSQDVSTTGTLKGRTAIVVNSDTAAYSVTTAQAQANTLFLTTNTATTTYTLPEAEAGMIVCIKNGQGNSQVLRLDTDGTDYIVMSTGARTSAAGDYYGATASATNKICAFAYNATDWYTDGAVGTWTEE